MILAGDIGSTKTHLAIFDVQGGALRQRRAGTFRSGDFQSLDGVIAAFAGPDLSAVEAACFGIAGPVEAWAEGQSLDVVLTRTTLAGGDLVRLLRMTIQLLRQAFHALDSADPARPLLLEARTRLDRDEVDAKRQLELG